MNKVNLADIPETERKSPKGKYCRHVKELSVALGSQPRGLDPAKKHPFDLMLARVPAGASFCPYHAHSAQWEMYLVLSGRGRVRDAAGWTDVGPGDTFVFRPGEAHEIVNPGPDDLAYYIVADNPPGDGCHYPDSGKWMVWAGDERFIVKGARADYFDGEEA